MARVKANSNNSAQELLKFYLEEELGVQDSEQLQGEESAEKTFEAFQNLFEKLQTVSLETQKLAKAQVQNSRPASAAPVQNPQSLNFNQMISAQKAIVKLQAWWRKEFTLKRLQKEVRDKRAAASMRKELDTPEETSLREFALQLSQRKLTPEGFFRMCDADYKQNVSVSIFKDLIQKLGIQLSRGQISRLILILDEDMEGNISREEYYNALEAYNVSGEKHKSLDGSVYHPFEHRCLFKLIAELRKKDISFLEMFNACDINDDSRVNIHEINRFVEGLSPDIKQKELHALMNYLDIDKNGLVDKDEFLRQLTRGEQTFKQTQIINKQIAERKMAQSQSTTNFMSSSQSDFRRAPQAQENNFFDEVVVGGGDQAFFGLFGSKVNEQQPANKSQTVNKPMTINNNAQDKPPQRVTQVQQIQSSQSSQQASSLTPDMEKRKVIIAKMEKEGLNFQSFFTSLKSMSSGGYVSLGTVLKSLEASYPSVAVNDRNFLIKDCMVERGKVDYIQLEELFTKFSKNLKPSVSQTFSIIATNIVKRMGGSPQESIRQFFKAQNVSETDMLSDIEFTQMFQGKFSTLSSRELEQAFNSLNVDMDGFVQVRDLTEVLLSYTNSTEKTAVNVSELAQIIPGFETMSPRTRCEEVIEYIIGELKKKNLKPINVFKMADAKNSGGVQAMMLEITFKKILPHIKNEVFQEALNAFKLKSNRDVITRQDYETVFNDEQSNSFVPHSAGVTNKSSSGTNFYKSQPAAQQQDEDESVKWIKKLDNAMLREGVGPSVAFKAADVNHNGLVTVDELRESIKKLIPDETLSLVELKKVMMAFDANKNGVIDEQEFISLIEKARNSTVTVVESPQKSRILNQDIGDDRRNKLPIKDQIGERKQLDFGDSLTTQVSNLEKRLNLKKFFAEIPLNEEGKMLVNHIGRRFKSEQLSDGTSLKPSEYLPIIKALDKNGQGFVEGKELIKFLDKNCSTNVTDCLFDLKYMANFIEFQMKNRNTIQFFLNNTQLKQGTRIMEVNIMHELSKVFGISMQIGNLIYRILTSRKGNNEIVLEDLCKLIDEYRIAKIDPAQMRVQTEAQKLDPEQILEKLAKEIMGLPKKMLDGLTQKLVQINQKEKLIPYNDFFVTFVDEYQLINTNESKSLFQYLKQQQSQQVNGLILTDFQRQLAKYYPKKEQPKPQQDLMSQSINDREILSIPQLIEKIEKDLRQPINQALDDFFINDQVPSLSIIKKLSAVQPTIDKALLTQFCQALDLQKQGKVLLKDLAFCLKNVKGRYDGTKVLQEVVTNIDQTTYNMIQSGAMVAHEQFTRNDFLDLISTISQPTSKFNATCLFYDFCGNSDTLEGDFFQAKILELRPPKQAQRKPTQQVIQPPEEVKVPEKKTVSFKELDYIKDVEKQKAMCQQFLQSQNTILTDTNIDSALKKICAAVKSFKTQAEAVARFDNSISGLIQIEQFRSKLDEVRNLTPEEKVILSFIPINQNKNDIFEINIENYIKYLRSLDAIPQIVNQNKQILTRNLDAAVKYFKLQLPPVQQQQQKPVQGTQSLPPAQTAEQKLERKRLKLMELMKNVIGGLRKGLQDAKKKQGLIDLFNSTLKQKLQYDEFYDYIENVLGVQAEDAEFEVFEQQIDQLGKGRIKFIDFVDFCTKFEIDFKTNLAKGATIFVDPREAKGEKLTCGNLTYIIVPERDYYNKCPTILNSEEAALVIAEKIYNSLGDVEFFDKDFGPKDDDDIEGSAKSMYCTGKPPAGYTNPDDVVWIRPEEMKITQSPQFIDDGAAANDVKQGAIGDCWFIGALSVLATRDELLRGGIGNIQVTSEFEADQSIALQFSKGVYPPMFHVYRRKGLYVFRFFKEFQWRYVIIDDRLPCYDSSRVPVFGSCTNLHELWVPLLEKAYAKLHGCYETLISGFIDDALNDLTGLVAEKLTLHNEQKIFPHKSIGDKETFWRMLMQRIEEKSMMGCSVTGDVERQITIDGQPTGIMTGHAYGLIDAFELKDPNMVNPRKTHRILRVRNPWGTMEWKGKWSDKSQELIRHKGLLDKYLASIVDEDERFTPGVEDGTFLINFRNWRDIYNNMYICVDFPQSWSGVRFQSEWNAQCSGGVPSPMTDDNRRKWAQNPQFLFNAKRDAEIFVSLAQPDGRGKRPDGSYLKFPYSDLIHPVLFTVCELPAGQKKLEMFDKAIVKFTSVLKEHREVSLRMKLPRGRYVIVPSTRSPGQHGPFTLSIYFSIKMKEVNITRIDNPENEYETIMEESENTNQVPDWKVDLCQKRIKYMMLEDDEMNDASFLNNSGMRSGSVRLSEMMSKVSAKKKQDSPAREFEYDDAFPDDEVIE